MLIINARMLSSLRAKVKIVENNGISDKPIRRGRKLGWEIEQVTPQSKYRIPILETLVECGGRAKISEVLESVFQKMENQLKDRDCERLPSGELRWKKQAQWERNKLKNIGYLKRNSPSGIWEISEGGSNFYCKSKLEQGKK
jgi:hypothetical protein